MMDNRVNNLIDDLLEHFKKIKGKYTGYKNRESIIGLVFPYFEDHSKLLTPLSRSSVYNAYYENDFRNYAYCYAYICDENSINKEQDASWRRIREQEILQFIDDCIEENALMDLKESLMELLTKTNIHDKSLADKMQFSIGQLRSFGDEKGGFSSKTIESWVKNIYYYFYFAVTDRLHSEVAMSMYTGLDDDLAEYNNEITMRYGAAGNPGMYQLYSLANRPNPNIIALYECGELEYYGKGPSGKVNYNEAYKYYEKTKNCNSEHPLASWSIAYMRFHYSTEYAKTHQEYRVDQFEAELSNGKGNSWYDAIIYNAETAYDYGCSAAANLLGKIVECSDEDFPIARRRKFKNKTAKELYKESADGNYVFGCNNYYRICMDEAASSENEEKVERWKEGIKYLIQSAKMGNPWAANRIANYYYNGLEIEGIRILEKDINTAYKNYKYAQIMSFSEHYYWPIINLCEKYWLNSESNNYMEKSKDYILKLVEESIKALKELDPSDDINKQIEALASIRNMPIMIGV